MYPNIIRTRVARSVLVTATALALIVVLATVVGPSLAAGQSSDTRPICNSLNFNIPSAVGQRVLIPTHQFAADPDVTPVRLASVFGGSNLGRVTISGNDVLFTRTNSSTGTATIFWTISDGTLSAQCTATGSNAPPPPGG